MSWGRHRRELVESVSYAQTMTVACAHCPEFTVTADFATGRDAQRQHLARVHPELVPKPRKNRRSYKQ